MNRTVDCGGLNWAVDCGVDTGSSIKFLASEPLARDIGLGISLGAPTVLWAS